MRSPNKYIIFCKFYKKILDEEFPTLSPRDRAIKAGKLWNFLPRDLQNSFATYANNERILKGSSNSPVQRPIISHTDLPIIFDDWMTDIGRSNQNPNQTTQTISDSESDVVFREMYAMYINEDASV
jgi:hypothetical protein